MSIANHLDRHSHQFTGQTPVIISPRSQASLADLQRRRDRAAMASNDAEGALYLASLSLNAATLHGDVAAMVRTSQRYRDASRRREETESALVAVLAEIEALLAAELEVSDAA